MPRRTRRAGPGGDAITLPRAAAGDDAAAPSVGHSRPIARARTAVVTHDRADEIALSAKGMDRMPESNEQLLIEQHRMMELGISGLVDGFGSRAELTAAVELLRRHIYVEEVALFPVLEQDERRWMALGQMKSEHGEMWPHIESALQRLAAKAPLDDLLPASEVLLELLHQHDPKEEEAIYSVADRYRADAAHPPLAELFTTSDIPDGWRCLRAPERAG